MTALRTVEVAFSFLQDVKGHVDMAKKIITDSNEHFESVFRLTLRPRVFTDALAVYNASGTQSEIDERIFDNIDIFIGLMHTRFGRPVEGSNSGAEHEYRKAIGAHKSRKKPKYILFGFGDELIRPSQVDGLQMEAVKKFRSEIQATQLYFSWDDMEQFRFRFKQQIDLVVLTLYNDPNNHVAGGLHYR
jgi:hypothetical protein